MGRPISPMELTPEEKTKLNQIVRARTTPQRDLLRARIVLLRAQGRKEVDVARTVGTSMTTVSLWSNRFELQGLDGLKDKKGRGRKPFLPIDKIQQVITRVTQPPQGKRRWSTRTMAKQVGISPDSVHRIWKANGGLRGREFWPRSTGHGKPYERSYHKLFLGQDTRSDCGASGEHFLWQNWPRNFNSLDFFTASHGRGSGLPGPRLKPASSWRDRSIGCP